MSELAQFLEHTILKPDTHLHDVQRICEEALRFHFAGICIPPPYVKDARRQLGDRNRVKLVTVVGFPMGYSTMSAKSEEIKRAMDDGADDIDAVLNIAWVKSGMWNNVSRDIDALTLASQSRGGTLKLILECGLLQDDEMKQVIDIAREHGVPWLKTSTGFHGISTDAAMVRRLRSMAGQQFRIKASGGIKTAETVRELIEAGADRIGTSSGVQIMTA